MAVYHLACRIQADGKANPPARIAKYVGSCALPSCGRNIQKGDTISCTRDNVNGARKGTEGEGRAEAPDTRADAPNGHDRGITHDGTTIVGSTDPVPNGRPCDLCGDDGSTRGYLHGRWTCLDETACAERQLPEETTSEGDDMPNIEPTATIAPNVALDALADAILPRIQGRVRAGLDESRVRAIVDAAVKGAHKPNATTVEVKLPDGTIKGAGLQHKQFPLLLKALSAGVNVWIVGPAGSGKTTAVHNCAKALGIDYSYSGTTNDAIHLSGFQNVHGDYVTTMLRQRYEHGGLHLLDEVDGWDASATLWLNAMLANGTAAFPDRMVDKHAKCILAATANTHGLGGTQEYVGRNRLDAAFLDRWVTLPWETDEALELATGPIESWTRRVQYIRSRVAAKGIKVLVTPRATYFGAALLLQGIEQDMVETMTLRKAMTAEQWRSVDT